MQLSISLTKRGHSYHRIKHHLAAVQAEFCAETQVLLGVAGFSCGLYCCFDLHAWVTCRCSGMKCPTYSALPLLSRGQFWDYMTTYAYYPPVFDVVTTVYFLAFGVNEVAGRLVAVTFAALGIWLLFEFTKRTYGPKNALVAAVLFGTMPGFFWLSRVTMLETMLIFFFTLVMFAFYTWLSKPESNRALILSGLALAIGVLAKYQIVVAGLAMLLSILFLTRKRLRVNLKKFLIIAIIVVAVVAPWFAAIYHYNGMTKFETIQYVMTEGGQDRPAYSNRFQPIARLLPNRDDLAIQRHPCAPHLAAHLHSWAWLA